MLKDKIKIILGELSETMSGNLIGCESSLEQSLLLSRINKAITIIAPGELVRHGSCASL